MTINDNCNCGQPWNAIIPKPPCPVHSFFPPITFPPRYQPQVVTQQIVMERLDDSYGKMTEEFYATFGVHPGYQEYKSKKRKKAMAEIREIWEDACDAAEVATIPVVVSLNEVIYPGGYELVYSLEGARNPFWVSDADEWRDNVLTVARSVKEALDQTTAQVVFRPVRLTYFRD